MGAIFSGKNVIINSETGSGKTLCYLLPIIMNMQRRRQFFQKKLITPTHTLIFAPTTELLHQIGAVCKELGVEEVSVAHDRSPLCVKKTTEFIITTPKFIMNYDWQAISNIDCIVFDETDLMFVAQFKEVRKVFEFFSGRKIDFSRKERLRRKNRESKQKYVFKQAEKVPQFVFAGATIPRGGRKTTLSLIERFVPNVQLIQSDMVHKVLKDTKFSFIQLEDNFYYKTLILAALLERELKASNLNLGSSGSLDDSEEQGKNFYRSIIFLNKVSTAEKLYRTLKENKKDNLAGSRYFTKDSASSEQNNGSETRLQNYKDDEKSNIEDFDFAQFVTKWHKYICFLHSGLPSSERLAVIDGFSKGKYNVLLTTGLAGRGLDIPNVNLVVQFDFPLNVADILHRAGRTGRAGSEGKVISLITEQNKDLYRLFRATINKDEDVSHLFSRKRRLRRRIKEGKLLQEDDFILKSTH
eukprot:gene1680-16156_t